MTTEIARAGTDGTRQPFPRLARLFRPFAARSTRLGAPEMREDREATLRLGEAAEADAAASDAAGEPTALRPASRKTGPFAPARTEDELYAAARAAGATILPE